MFQAFAVNVFIKVLCSLMCQFLGYCCNEEDCPDGVCEPLIDDLEKLQAGVPVVSVNPAKVQAAAFKPDWSKLDEVIAAMRELIKSVIAFLNKDEISVG